MWLYRCGVLYSTTAPQSYSPNLQPLSIHTLSRPYRLTALQPYSPTDLGATLAAQL